MVSDLSSLYGYPRILEPKHLIAGILGTHSNSLITLLKELGLQIYHLEQAAIAALKASEYSEGALEIWARQIHIHPKALLGPDSRGTQASYVRESRPDQLSDHHHSYAESVASTFLAAGTGDFCFALFGSWGLGKTTLARSVRTNLENRGYATTVFNAWKYPNRPEIWGHLFENIKRTASQDSLLQKIRLAVDCQLRKDQGWPLLSSVLLLLFASIPKVEMLQWLFPSITLGAIFLLAGYFRVTKNHLTPALRHYLSMPSHASTMGLQGAIGDDLKRLLKAWIPSSPEPNEREPAAKESCFASGAFQFTISLLFLGASIAIFIHRVWAPHPSKIVEISGALAICLFIFWLLKGRLRQSRKALLIVDDLDRCDPTEMLAVIESIRVFLDDREISERLQVMMLMDREILSLAIRSRYKEFLGGDQTTPHDAEAQPDSREAEAKMATKAHRLVIEQVEKYFLLYLNLPPLSDKELWETGEKILASHMTPPPLERHAHTPPVAKVDSTAPVDDQTDEEGDAQTPNTLPDKRVREDFSKKEQVQSSEPVPSLKERFHDEEDEDVDLTDREVKKLLETFVTDNVIMPQTMTPRRMHAMKMRYFLARQILRKLDEGNFEAANLIPLMSENAFEWQDGNGSSNLHQIAALVTWRQL